MRVLILIFSIIFCASCAQAYQFIFKNGKSIEGTVIQEDASTYQLVDLSGVAMRIRKAELNLAATESVNVIRDAPAAEPPMETPPPAPAGPTQHPVRIYSNLDIAGVNPVKSAPSDPHSETAWKSHISKLERQFARLKGQCRGAGTGANFSKVWRSETYRVNGKSVRVKGYWADPANIETAKSICRTALQTEKALNDARLQFSQFQEMQTTSAR
jgi:hypothetical protein